MKQDDIKPDLTTPQGRLEHFIKSEFQGNYTAFAKQLDISYNQLKLYTGKRGSVFGPKFLPKLKKLGLNTDWYITGEGSMLLNINDEFQKINLIQLEENMKILLQKMENLESQNTLKDKLIEALLDKLQGESISLPKNVSNVPHKTKT